jgi:lysophospholipase L1-like esterase
VIFYLTAPILLVQGRRVRATTPRLPEAGGPAAGTARPRTGGPGTGRGLRVAVVGESTAAGVGARSHSAALPGFLPEELAARTGAPVAWTVDARTGYTADRVRRELLPGLAARPRPDAVVVAIGVNDLLAARPLARFERDVADLVRGVRAAAGAEVPIVLSGMAPLHRFPALPQPMRAILGWRARAMDARLLRVAARLPCVRHRTFALPADTDAFFGADGFHPGPDGYRRWAAEIAPDVAEMAGAARTLGRDADTAGAV